MEQFFLGADLGGTRTRVMVADVGGRVIGFGESGPGNHESVGFEGFTANLNEAVSNALRQANLTPGDISGAGFGIAGYDWPIEYQPTMDVIATLGLRCPIELVNDSELGLLSGSPRGWGVAVVSGTGCNCRGWDVTRKHHGRVTGGGMGCGEFAGATELMYMATHAMAYEWTGRGPATALSGAFTQKFKVASLHDLLQGLICHQFEFSASDAPTVFQVAAEGDPVAVDLIRWAGRELGEMALTVIRQLHFETIEFDLVQIGSMFDGSPLLTEEMKNVVLKAAPGANFIRAKEPPVMGALLLAMEASGIRPGNEIRAALTASIPVLQNSHNEEM